MGVDVEVRADLARLAAESKPKILKSEFGPSGDLTIEFNQDMKLINQAYTKNMSTIMEMKMESYEF